MFGKESLPHLHEVFSIIQADEGRRNVMLDTLVEEGSPGCGETILSKKTMVAKLLTSKAAEGRHSSHRSIKMNFGAITARNQDTPRKLAGN